MIPGHIIRALKVVIDIAGVALVALGEEVIYLFLRVEEGLEESSDKGLDIGVGVGGLDLTEKVIASQRLEIAED